MSEIMISTQTSFRVGGLQPDRRFLWEWSYKGLPNRTALKANR